MPTFDLRDVQRGILFVLIASFALATLGWLAEVRTNAMPFSAVFWVGVAYAGVSFIRSTFGYS